MGRVIAVVCHVGSEGARWNASGKMEGRVDGGMGMGILSNPNEPFIPLHSYAPDPGAVAL
jgi:hypothetical protein